MTDAAESPARTGLTVVIPCYNEADNIQPSYREILAELGTLDLEIIYVDDGSTDGTLEAIRRIAESDPRVQYISFTRNFGFEAAFSAGYRYASRPWILHIDADQQFPAAEAWVLIEAAEHGHDAVFGVRTNRQDPRLRRWGTAAFHYIGRRILRIEIPRGATAFRLVRSDLAREIVDLRLPTPYFLATVPRLTNRYTTVPVRHRPRTRGESKVGFGFLSAHAVELFVGFSSRPTTAASIGTLLSGLLALLLAAASAAGLVGGHAIAAVLLLLLAVVLFTLSLTVRHLVVLGGGQARPRQFYIRESTLPVRDDDRLCVTSRFLGATP